MIKTSIIIATFNGEKKIGNLLNSLEKQSVKNFEVIIVIDGSTDRTKELLQTTSLDLQEVVIIEQPNGGRSIARNAGAKKAKGELLIFFDDDMRLGEECVKHHQLHHIHSPGSIMVGTQLEDYNLIKTDIQKYKGELSRNWVKPLLQNKGAMSKETLFITAANFSISKEIYYDLSGFDEQLTDAEDFDLAVRAFKVGIPIYYNPKALGWHDDFITCRSYIKRQRQYALAHKKLIALKPWMKEEGFIKPVQMPVGLKEKVFKFFSNQGWLEFINSPSVMLLPKKIRYKLYDLIITGNGVLYPDKVKL
jgi:GT2 family glycosyltransferase